MVQLPVFDVRYAQVSVENLTFLLSRQNKCEEEDLIVNTLSGFLSTYPIKEPFISVTIMTASERVALNNEDLLWLVRLRVG